MGRVSRGQPRRLLHPSALGRLLRHHAGASPNQVSSFQSTEEQNPPFRLSRGVECAVRPRERETAAPRSRQGPSRLDLSPAVRICPGPRADDVLRQRGVRRQLLRERPEDDPPQEHLASGISQRPEGAGRVRDRVLPPGPNPTRRRHPSGTATTAGAWPASAAASI